MSDKTICKDCGATIWQESEKALDGTTAIVWMSVRDGGWICAETDEEHEPLPPFTGVPGYEHDAWGNAICGHDFMAGTICTDARGHDGGHSATCLRCGNDWYDGSCTCKDPSAEEDDTWRKTYPEKPDWWDDVHEPRCDVCGIHFEDAEDRSPGSWDGDCGNCAEHCTCGDAEYVNVHEAVTLGIFAINTLLAPDASSAEDVAYLEAHAEEALVGLARIREWIVAQGEDLPEWLTEPMTTEERS